MRVAFALLVCADAAAFNVARPALPVAARPVARTALPTMIGEWEKRQIGNSDIPEIIMGKVRLSLATKRSVNDEKEIIMLWDCFKKCYATRALAVEAAEKNSAVFNPQLNAPSKIEGTFKLLVGRLGKKGAQELIMKNPGVLVCSPQSLEKESTESILKAADFVEVIEANKPLIRVVAGTIGVLFLASVTYGVIARNYGADWVSVYLETLSQR